MPAFEGAGSTRCGERRRPHTCAEGSCSGRPGPPWTSRAGRIHVTQALAKGPKGEPPRFGPPKTDRGRRAVPLDPQTVKTLKKHRCRQLRERLAMGDPYRDHGLTFCREDGRPLDPDVVSHSFWQLVRQAGLPVIRFHDLRHTFATLSLKAGIPTEVVSRILGHKNPSITQVFYQHAVPSLEEDAIRRFAALVDRAHTG